MTGALEDFNRAVHGAARQLAVATLEQDRSEGALIALVGEAVRLAEQINDDLVARNVPDMDAIACSAGCAWCCYHQVGVTAPQAFAIAAHIRNGEADLPADALSTRLAALDEKVHGMDRRARLEAALPCAFLEDDRCTIYDARPFACRGANSVDAEFCRRMLGPDARDTGAAPDRAWLHRVPYEAMANLQSGFLAGTVEAGLRDDRLELTAAVRIALENDGAAAAWLSGEDIFADARLPAAATP